MVTFTVHHRDRDADAILRDADTVEFVREGFSWIGFAVPILWFAVHGLWLVLALYLAAVGALSYLGGLAGLSELTVSVTGLGLNLLVGFEANNLRRWTLRRRRLREVAIVSGSSLHEAELRFFDALIEDGEGEHAEPPLSRPAPPGPVPAASVPARAPATNPAAIFPEPGGLR